MAQEQAAAVGNDVARRRPGIVAPVASLLAAGVLWRLAAAAALSLVLWLAVAAALGWIG